MGKEGEGRSNGDREYLENKGSGGGMILDRIRECKGKEKVDWGEE